MQEKEIPFRPSESQEITQERLQDHPTPQHLLAHHAKTPPAMPDEKETEMEVTRGIGHCGVELIGTGTELYHSCPNEKWVTDITHIQYESSTLYLSTIMDLYNNEIVAHKLFDHLQTPLVVDTLNEALELRGYSEGSIIHFDQGSVYMSYAY